MNMREAVAFHSLRGIWRVLFFLLNKNFITDKH